MTMPDAHEVRQLADEIIQLEEKLGAARQRLQGLFSAVTPTLQLTPNTRRAAGRPAREDSVASRILVEIDTDPLIHWDAAGISNRLGIAKRVAETALYNLNRAGKIARHSRGKYESLHQTKQGVHEEQAA